MEDKDCKTCEGTGEVPVPRDTENMAHRMLWFTKSQTEPPAEDGTHVLPCLDCIQKKEEL